MRIYLDLDGVCCDFVAASYRIHGRDYRPADVTRHNYFEEWPTTAGRFWAPIDRAGAKFWADLPAFPWMGDLVALVAEYDPWFRILSAPRMTPAAHAGRVAWLRRYLPAIPPGRIILTTQKADLAAAGRVLIDDSDDQVDRWRRAGGETVTFPQYHNRARDVRPGDLAVVRETLEQIRSRTE